MVYKCFDKKTSNTNKGTEINSDVISENKESDKELQKPIIRKFEKQKYIHLLFIHNISDTSLTDMQLLSKFDKRIQFLLCVIDIFIRYAGVVFLKAKIIITINGAFQKILNETPSK